MMSTWTEGYVTDHTYDHSYFPMLSPQLLEFVLLLSGQDMAKLADGEPMRYLELGYGQGLSLNIHAATIQEAEFWGTDFLPEQAQNARDLSHRADLGTQALNYSFAELDELSEAGHLPEFDMIVMHGIWSWINIENRRHILNIIRNNLKPHGIVYVSYNAMPGRTMHLPLRELIALHADRKGKGKNTATSAKEASRLVQALSDAKAAFFAETPALQSTIKMIGSSSSAYLAHEYLNRNWHADYFADVAKDMAAAGCNFTASANPLDSLSIAQPENTIPFLDKVSDPVKREVLRDFNLNRGFRTDIFIKGDNILPVEEFRQRLDESFLAMKIPLSSITALTVDLGLYKSNLDKNLYYPILEILAENDYAPKTVASLRTHPRLADLAYEVFLFRITVLLGGQFISPARPSPSQKTLAACQRLNRIQCDKTAKGDVQQWMVSPVLGCGIYIAEHFQLFLRAYLNGKKTPEGWAVDAYSVMRAQKKSYVPKSSDVKETGKALLMLEARDFEESVMPYLKAIGLVPPTPFGKT